ncbi:conserved hypothetical protein [uncultured Pleomorphomonas sp.]|uniref:DUF1217 domain-containing protein n=1 Tax=uncultured Pleomorphomonas sp. TaxID=442121 RepID=A0A212LNW1_9HYPH|nr:DUF1217 domain-containing protein [uncultured Pleomorphomonas sp.]SCM79242.1 conserved hypothetical protein [uncultured Pleomorphomonas sp.]
MVSTYLSYTLLTRDLDKSLVRIAQQASVKREAEYYQSNIGKVKSVDGFMKDDRLYRYAMKAYGLEDMTYAKAFMRRVLESDLLDSSSFANKLTDARYRQFAAAFSFRNDESVVVQSSSQTDGLVELYTTTVNKQATSVGDDTRYYNVAIDRVGNVNDLLNDNRLRNYVFTAFGIQDSHYARQDMAAVLSSDPADPASYVNTVWGPRRDDATTRRNSARDAVDDATARIDDYTHQLALPDADIPDLNAKIAEQRRLQAVAWADMNTQDAALVTINRYFDLAAAFQFSADGTLPDGVKAQTEQSRDATNRLYVANQPRTSPTGALMERSFFEDKVASARTVDELLDDGAGGRRMASFLGTAFGLGAMLPETIRSILTSDRDPANPNSFVNQAGRWKEPFTRLMNAFNFRQDGTLDAADAAQSQAQTTSATSAYMSAYNDADEAADRLAIKNFRESVYTITSLDKFLTTPKVYNFALQSVGLDPARVSLDTIKKVMKSDLNDPNSYVHQLKDDRYLQLARSFNFDGKGNLTTPLVAQDRSEIADISKDYIIAKTKFAKGVELTALRKKADADAEYYRTAIAGVDSVADLLADRKAVDILLVAKGLDPKKVSTDYLRKVLTSDRNDPKSFANAASDKRFAEIASAFNFDTSGNVVRVVTVGPQKPVQVRETVDGYYQQTMETQEGNSNPGVRLALYFRRKAADIRTAYDILADPALSQVFRTTYNLPDATANMEIDQQARVVEKYLDLKDLSDPQRLEKLLQRFTAMYDLTNSKAGSPSLVTLMQGAGGSINQNTLMAIAKLGRAHG